MEISLWIWIAGLTAFVLALAFFLRANLKQSGALTGRSLAALNAGRRAREAQLRRELVRKLHGDQDKVERLFQHKRRKHSTWDNVRCLESVIDDLGRDNS